MFVDDDYRPAVQVKPGRFAYIGFDSLVTDSKFPANKVVRARKKLSQAHSKLAQRITSSIQSLDETTEEVIAERTREHTFDFDYKKKETDAYLKSMVIPAFLKVGLLRSTANKKDIAFINGLLKGERTVEQLWQVDVPYQALFDTARESTPKSTSMFVFHGTSKLSLVLPLGFDLSKIKSGVHGWGIYFSDDVLVSSAYSPNSYLIVAELLVVPDELTKSVSSACVVHRTQFICRSSHCCVPRFLVELK